MRSRGEWLNEIAYLISLYVMPRDVVRNSLESTGIYQDGETCISNQIVINCVTGNKCAQRYMHQCILWKLQHVELLLLPKMSKHKV